jgi:hypothetical protein
VKPNAGRSGVVAQGDRVGGGGAAVAFEQAADLPLDIVRSPTAERLGITGRDHDAPSPAR